MATLLEDLTRLLNKPGDVTGIITSIQGNTATIATQGGMKQATLAVAGVAVGARVRVDTAGVAHPSVMATDVYAV